jgi:ribulose kinase
LVGVASRDIATQITAPAMAEQSPADWMEGIVGATRDCVSGSGVSPENVVALSVAATSSTVVFAGGDRMLRLAILWMDTRAEAEAREISAFGHQVLGICGGTDSPEWMVPKALWVKRHEAPVYNTATRIGEALDWINYNLTGQWVGSLNTAICKWNYSPGAGFSTEFLRLFDLEDVIGKWPSKFLPIGSVIGFLKEDAANRIGLTDKTLVVQGGVDAYLGMLGSGVVTEGDVALILGTSSVFLAPLSHDKPMEGVWGPYPGILPHGFLVAEGGQISSGAVLKWWNDQFFPGSDQSELLRETAAIPPGARGLLALDFFQGNRTPYKDPLACGMISGLTLSHTKADVFKALMESTALGARLVLSRLCGREKTNRLIVSGGGTRSREWVQVHADVLQAQLTLPEYAEYGTMLGAAMSAATGYGLHKSLVDAVAGMHRIKGMTYPNSDNKDCYDRLYQIYMNAYVRNVEIMHSLRSR